MDEIRGLSYKVTIGNGNGKEDKNIGETSTNFPRQDYYTGEIARARA